MHMGTVEVAVWTTFEFKGRSSGLPEEPTVKASCNLNKEGSFVRGNQINVEGSPFSRSRDGAQARIKHDRVNLSLAKMRHKSRAIEAMEAIGMRLLFAFSFTGFAYEGHV